MFDWMTADSWYAVCVWVFSLALGCYVLSIFTDDEYYDEPEDPTHP